MVHNLPALVIREADYGENDKILTLLSAERGKFSVAAKGIKSLRNKNMASSQTLCYSDFTVNEKNGYYSLKEASLIEQFFNLRNNLDKYSAALYAADIAAEVCVENSDESEMLSLLLNTLYVLSESDRDTDIVKAVFELRCTAVSGFMPSLSECAVCGRNSNSEMYLDVMNGVIKCGECFGSDSDEVPSYDTGTAIVIVPLSAEVLDAMRYIISCPPKRIFSFSLAEDQKNSFCRTCEKYLLNQLGHSFNTLDFYKKIRAL